MEYFSRQNLFKLAITALFLGSFAYILSPFWTPLLMAAIFGLALKPLLVRFNFFPKLRWRFSVALSLLLIMTVLFIPAFLAAYKSYAYLVDISKKGIKNTPIYEAIVTVRNHGLEWLEHFLSAFDFKEPLDLALISDEAITKIGNWVIHTSGELAGRIPELSLNTLVFFLALYVFIAESRRTRNFIRSLKVLSDSELNQFVKVLQESSYNVLVTSVFVGLVQAAFVSLGSIIFSAGDVLIVFVLTFCLSFVPVVGAAPVAFLLALHQLLLQNYGAASGLAVVGAITGILDNVLRPYLMSTTTEGPHPVVATLSIIGAILVFGMPGLFLGPIICSVSLQVMPIFFSDNENTPAP